MYCRNFVIAHLIILSSIIIGAYHHAVLTAAYSHRISVASRVVLRQMLSFDWSYSGHFSGAKATA
jgi:hypothetical protein